MISEARIQELEDMVAKLLALEAGGVDNWEHYDVSLEEYRKEKERREREEDWVAFLVGELAEAASTNIDEPAGHGCGYGIEDSGLELIESLIREHCRIPEGWKKP